MQLFVIARAHKDRLERYKNDLSAMYFEYEHKKGKKGMLQMGVRPVEILELCFPEKDLEEVLNTIRPAGTIVRDWKDAKLLNKFLFLLRKLLGLEKVPKTNLEARRRFLHGQDICITSIGIKKDIYDEDGIEKI